MEPCVYFLEFISPIVWNMCEHLLYESVYFKELPNEQEYYWPSRYRPGAAVVSTITSFINCYGSYASKYLCDWLLRNKKELIQIIFLWWKQKLFSTTVEKWHLLSTNSRCTECNKSGEKTYPYNRSESLKYIVSYCNSPE